MGGQWVKYSTTELENIRRKANSRWGKNLLLRADFFNFFFSINVEKLSRCFWFVFDAKHCE